MTPTPGMRHTCYNARRCARECARTCACAVVAVRASGRCCLAQGVPRPRSGTKQGPARHLARTC
eukprot:3240580-Alexandrium_andersonii.AAC.1